MFLVKAVLSVCWISKLCRGRYPMTDYPDEHTWTVRGQLNVVLKKLNRMENTMSELTAKLDRLAALWEADEVNDAAVLAEVVRARDEAIAARDEALSDDAADAARISELEADVSAASVRLDELLAMYGPVEPEPEPEPEPEV